MDFTGKVEKLIAEATAKYQKIDAHRKQLQEDKAILDQNIARTIEEELRVVGELRALETVRKGTTDSVPDKEN